MPFAIALTVVVVVVIVVVSCVCLALAAAADCVTAVFLVIRIVCTCCNGHKPQANVGIGMARKNCVRITMIFLCKLQGTG